MLSRSFVPARYAYSGSSCTSCISVRFHCYHHNQQIFLPVCLIQIHSKNCDQLDRPIFDALPFILGGKVPLGSLDAVCSSRIILSPVVLCEDRRGCSERGPIRILRELTPPTLGDKEFHKTDAWSVIRGCIAPSVIIIPPFSQPLGESSEYLIC